MKSNIPYRNQAIKMVNDILISRGAQWDKQKQQEDNFQAIAKVWSVIMRHKLTADFTARDVAKMMTVFKAIRDGQSETMDNLLDMAGYAIIGLACGLAEQNEFNFDSLHPNEVTLPDFDVVPTIDDAPPNAEIDPIAKIRAKKVWDQDRWADDGGMNYDAIADHIAENTWKQYDVISDPQSFHLPKWVETKIGNLEGKSSGEYYASDRVYPDYTEGEQK